MASGRALPALLTLGTGATILTLMMLVRAVLGAIPGAGGALNLWHVEQIVGYAPMFLFGMVLARAAGLRQALLARPALPVAILAVVIGATLLSWSGPAGIGQASAWIERPLGLAAAAFCPPAATILILRSAFAIRGIAPMVRSVCAAAFTIYILHFPIAVMMNIALSHVAANVYLEYAAVILVSTSAAYWLHWQLVARSPSLSLLLNGRRQRDGVPMRSSPTEPVAPTAAAAP